MVKMVSCSATSSFAGCISSRRFRYVRLGVWGCIKYNGFITSARTFVMQL